MSQGEKMPLATVEPIARELVDLLRLDCERIEIAGSIRRRRPEVGDIEIVAIPKMLREVSTGFFADLSTTVETDLLDARLGDLLRHGRVAARRVETHRADGSIEYQTKFGPAYKALVFREIPVDLFTVRPPAEWGVLFALRTGPGAWNIRLVEECKRYFRRVEGGRVLHLGQPVPCPEEADFFRAIGQPWVDPAERSIERVAIGRPETAVS